MSAWTAIKSFFERVFSWLSKILGPVLLPVHLASLVIAISGLWSAYSAHVQGNELGAVVLGVLCMTSFVYAAFRTYKEASVLKL